MTFHATITRWREQAQSPFVPDDVRRAVLACADELEAEITVSRTELLNQSQAAEELGVTTSTIRRWEREERLYRARPDRAVYRRCDLLAAARGAIPRRTLELVDSRA